MTTKKYTLTKRLLTFVAAVMVVTTSMMAADDVTCTLQSNRITILKNGILEVKINAKGHVYSFTYNDNNMLGTGGDFYFSTQEGADFDNTAGSELKATKAEVVAATADYAEVVYTCDTARLVKQQGFILRKGDSKLYTYIIMKGTSTPMVLEEARVAYRVADNFLDAYVSDAQQGLMPTVAQMNAFTDDDKIQDATYRLSDGTVYTKYDNAVYLKDTHVFGIMNTEGTLGVWAIQASTEYVNGGPLRQDLTVHMDTKSPVICQYFQGGHFGGTKLQFNEGDVKMFGPFALYCNSGSREEMIADAKVVAKDEVKAWPYSWFTNEAYPLDRSTVTGNICLTNYATTPKMQVVLGEAGVDPYMQTRGYCYWAETGSDGSFTIPNVRKGIYALHVYALEGEITDMLEQTGITISDATQDIGTISWTPTRYETLLWRIGENDRLSDGFCLSDHVRQYGVFDECPADLDFTIGTSSEATDWYYAQTKAGMWTIHFNLDSKPSSKCYLTLSVAAAARQPNVKILVNGRQVTTKQMDTNDGSIYRSAMRSGRYNLYTFDVLAALLKEGENTISLTLDKTSSGCGVMWDCIKLETGDKMTSGIGDALRLNDHVKMTNDKVYDLQGRQVANPTKGMYIRNGKKIIIK